MIGKHILAGVALAAMTACSGAGGTAAPTTEADKQKMASEIATLMSDPKMVDGLMDSMRTSMEASMQPMLGAACEVAPADAQSECNSMLDKMRPILAETLAESMEQTKAVMPELMKDMGGIMARTYTGEELARMKDFYASPEGKSITAKQPQVMAEYMPKVMERLQGMQMDMMRKMQDRMMKAMLDAGVPPPAQPPI
jgi:hypothetical protein